MMMMTIIIIIVDKKSHLDKERANRRSKPNRSMCVYVTLSKGTSDTQQKYISRRRTTNSLSCSPPISAAVSLDSCNRLHTRNSPGDEIAKRRPT